jgi:hypothetical protein
MTIIFVGNTRKALTEQVRRFGKEILPAFRD